MVTLVREVQTVVALRCKSCRRLLGKAEQAVTTAGEDTWTLTTAAPVRLAIVCPRCGVLTRFDTRTWMEG